MKLNILQAAGIIFGIVAMLLCVSTPSTAETAPSHMEIAIVASSGGSMKCCPENSTAQQRSCAAQCPVVPATAYVIVPSQIAQTVDFDSCNIWREGISPEMDMPPPR